MQRLREEDFLLPARDKGGLMRIKLKEYYDRMEQAVSAILTNADVQLYLKKIALFRNYSFANTLLIILQRPSATRVAGLVTWNKLGRYVKQGEKGIMIFAPMFAKRTRHDEPPEEGVTEDLVETSPGRIAAKGEATCLAGFKAVYVYDIAQTHGAEVSCKELKGSFDFVAAEGVDPRALFAKIVSANPVAVRFRTLSETCRGYYDAQSDEIVLSASLADPEKPRTLIHEMAHRIALLGNEHTLEYDERPMAEVIAEGAAFIVCSYLGIDTGSCSFSYVAAWGKDAKKIISWGSAVLRTANRIIDLIEHDQSEEKKAA
jgi:antirestriction protein ArdC